MARTFVADDDDVLVLLKYGLPPRTVEAIDLTVELETEELVTEIETTEIEVNIETLEIEINITS